MPLVLPGDGDLNVISNSGIVGNANPGTGVPSNATTLLYGAVTELISAANNVQDSWGLEISILETGASATDSACSLDILIGGATDDVLISSLLCSHIYAGAVRTWFFPVHIPAGVRLAARFASIRTSITPRVLVNLYGGMAPPFRVARKVITYGTKVNNARGQAVTPSTGGAAASVTQMTASTSEDHFAFMPGLQISGTTTVSLKNYAIGIGLGASTEQRVDQTWWLAADASEKTAFWPNLPMFVDVPAASRLTLLVSNSGGNDTGYDGHIYALS